MQEPPLYFTQSQIFKLPPIIQIIPVNITKNSGRKSNFGEMLSDPTCFDMVVREDTFSSGWALLQGVLIRRGGDYDARLYFDLGEGFVESQYVKVSASGKGVINEVVFLPAGIKRIRFSPMRASGEFELTALSFTKIGSLERVWRMVRRVVAMIYLHSRLKRKVIRLNLIRTLLDLRETYNVANTLRVHAGAPDYAGWLARFDTLGTDDDRLIEKQITHFAHYPHFRLLLVANGVSASAVQETLKSLKAQIYRNFTTEVLDVSESDFDLEAGISNAGQCVGYIARDAVTAWLTQFNVTLMESREDEWVMLLKAGDVLASHALYQFAREVLAKPEAAVLYSDDDVLNVNGQRCTPRFKPDWSLTHFRSTNFVGDAVALRGSDLVNAGGLSLDCCRYGSYDLLLRLVDMIGDAGFGKVVHIPALLLHRAVSIVASSESQWCLDALRAHLVRNGVDAEVSETLPGCWRVRYQSPAVPLVSIIVPTRDALGLIRQCVESLLEKTTYSRFEILVVDNQSADPDVLAYLEQIVCYEKVRVLRYDHPFNYSAMNNMAVREARGAVVCLLNNDTEVISPDWLKEMVGHLQQPRVGVVGAKLYFPDGRVQHGGDLVGVGGVANHAHAYLRCDDPSYCNRALVAQELSAVTAACLVTWKAVYLQLGGLDEKHLKVAFNDVDYCLRVREAGYRVVWTPHAELYHHESVSRGKDSTRRKKWRANREAAYMRKQWKHVMQNDPFYNPNLSYERPDFSLSHAPLIVRPWKT